MASESQKAARLRAKGACNCPVTMSCQHAGQACLRDSERAHAERQEAVHDQEGGPPGHRGAAVRSPRGAVQAHLRDAELLAHGGALYHSQWFAGTGPLHLP